MKFTRATTGSGCIRRMFTVGLIVLALNLQLVESSPRGLRTAKQKRDQHKAVHSLHEHKPRVFVCVTGQLARVELANKFENLILPLVDAGFQTDVGFVLSTGEAHFSHTKGVKNTTLPTVESVLEFASKYPASTRVNVYDVLADPQPSAAYVEAVKKHRDHNAEQHFERLQNHARMVDSYQRCWKMAQMNGGSKLGATIYDVFVRVREDIGFDAPFNPEIVAKISQETRKVIATPPCRMWHLGTNDRMAVVSSPAAKDYFNVPVEVMVNDPHKKLGQDQVSVSYRFAMNTETFLRSAYGACDIAVDTSYDFPHVHRIHRLPRANGGVREAFVSSDVKSPLCLTPEELEEFHNWPRSRLVNSTRLEN